MHETGTFGHDGRYELQRLLGRGAFSEVWLAHDRKTHVDVALKIYAPSTGLDDEGLEMFAHEFSVVMNINHRNLLKPIYFDDFERQPYLVLPYCPGGSVKSRIGKLTEAEAWKMLRDVAAGLAELHAKHPPVVHQDIKPDNIMQDDEGRYLITDFGVSTKLRSTLRRSQASKAGEYDSAGTMAYMAPERFSRMNKPVMSNDIYSLGATMFEMLTGDVPFGNLGGVAQVNGAVVPYLDCDCSDQLKQVVERCLAKDPWDRPVAAQLEEWAKIGFSGGEIDFERKWQEGGSYNPMPPSQGSGRATQRKASGEDAASGAGVTDGTSGTRAIQRESVEGGADGDGDPSTPAFGSLSVSSVPTGAEVYIDGAHVGTTPFTFPGLSAGTHQVEIRKEGYATGTKSATVRAGREAAVSLALQAIPGPAPTPTPPSSGLSLGKKLGIAAAVVVCAVLGAVVALLTPTKHSGRGNDNSPVIAEVVTDTGTVAHVDGPSEPTPAPSENMPPVQPSKPAAAEPVTPAVTAPTELSLSCETSGATLYVDGVKKGTDSWTGSVSPGSHRLEARKDGYTTATHTLTVREGHTVDYTFPALTASTGSLRVTSDPTGADVYIDGSRMGTTPGTFTGLAAGAHQVELRKTGYTTGMCSAIVSDGQEAAVSLTLQSTGRNTINGHEYVDLGLSVRWATCNVGANSPGDYGNYYAWGETSTKSAYEDDNSKTYKKKNYNYDIAGDPNLDAARSNWGGTWRMPTEAECRELLNGCTWQLTTQDNHSGYRLTSKINGNSIFIPASGSYLSCLVRSGELGCFWCSSPNGTKDATDACCLYFAKSVDPNVAKNYGRRSWGHPVRPVSQ